MPVVLSTEKEKGKQGQRSEKEAAHSRGWHGVGRGGKGHRPDVVSPLALHAVSVNDPTRGATPAQDVPARHNDDILSNAGHLLDGQVAHAAECGLKRA